MNINIEIKDIIPPCVKCRYWKYCCEGNHYPDEGSLKKRIYNLLALGEDCYTIPSGYDNWREIPD